MRFSAMLIVSVVAMFAYQQLSAQNPALNITISPSSTTASNSAFTLTIIGNGFVGTPRVFMGGNELQIMSTSSTTILAQVPASLNAQAGMLIIQVIQNTMGIQMGFNTRVLSINAPNFNGAPGITRITPSWLPPSGGRITIIGWNFSTLATVRLHSVTLAIVSISTTQIIAIVPPNTLRFASVSVTNPDGQSASQVWGYINNVAAQPPSLLLSPNPAHNTLTFTTTLNRASHLRCTLRTTLGAVVMEERHVAAAGDFSTALDVSAFPSGIYFLEVSDDAGGRWMQKVVKY